jgi:hypothetical protein
VITSGKGVINVNERAKDKLIQARIKVSQAKVLVADAHEVIDLPLYVELENLQEYLLQAKYLLETLTID